MQVYITKRYLSGYLLAIFFGWFIRHTEEMKTVRKRNDAIMKSLVEFSHSQGYDHEGPLQDESDAINAVVSWSNGTPRNTATWTNWSQAPHSLHYMMYALWENTW